MTALPLSLGMADAIERYKAACEAAVDATGTRADVAVALGLDQSTLSRALNHDRPDALLNPAQAMRLEKLSRRTFFADVFASLTAHHVVADEESAREAGDVVDHIVSMTKEHSEAVGAMAEVRVRPTPSNARVAIKEISESAQAAQAAIGALTSIAAGRAS